MLLSLIHARTPIVRKARSAERYFSNISRLKVLFFGTDHFSLPSLKIIHKNLIDNGRVKRLEVVTSFKAAKNPVKWYSQTEGIPLHDWASFSRTAPGSFDLGVVVSFGHLIPESLINCFQRGMLNVHASLLPKLRGAAPIVHAIANGDQRTGVTIMRIKPRQFDVGEILLQSTVDIGRDTLMPELHDRLANVGAECLISCMEDLETYYRRQTVQNDAEATYAPKIDQKFAEISWRNSTAVRIYDLYRSLYGLRPLLTTFGGDVVKIYKLSFNTELQVQGQLPTCLPGHVEYSKRKKQLLVRCGDGRLLQILQLSIGGKKMLTGQDFYNGFLSKVQPSERYFK
ncbi:methionyl-tRNA formyltransferase, mitochondrial [Anopheles stephensi]|uniref:Methionyl-tRNA formyltransferase, mitochondrial n=1 Tax=Anopheles stephensi TaxID=30069 RepID=A0A182YH72_ANOST|nr:methionyl-tRNA formyltransferase, mitochondrial [Anopheles stephensi]XP_035894957.1 methionyl-tRNA formyltransferase, mitochondrial [Anopheles stephensi]XP_035894965.1 methionyl-tRNA formyltransferase, mitochondrial [Anopheles stephensi]XP_035894973.1 methionyl-tRNA formyltransferase, mitochondrial [Anopheles stephensi]